MTIKEEVLRIVEGLSEVDLYRAKCLLGDLTERPADASAALDELLANCEEEDETISEEERLTVEQSWREYDAGNVIAHEELMRRRLSRQGS